METSDFRGLAHVQIIPPGPVGTTIGRITRKTAGSGFASTLALAGPDQNGNGRSGDSCVPSGRSYYFRAR